MIEWLKIGLIPPGPIGSEQRKAPFQIRNESPAFLDQALTNVCGDGSTMVLRAQAESMSLEM